MNTRERWADEHVERLKALWNDHDNRPSDTQIADILTAEGFAVSRMSVIGKRHRLGLRESVPEARRRNRPPPAKVATVERPKGQTDSDLLRRIFTPKFAAHETQVTAEFLGIAMDDLEPHHCRFAGDGPPYLFCGQPKQHGSSYCPHHHEICWVSFRSVVLSRSVRREGSTKRWRAA